MSAAGMRRWRLRHGLSHPSQRVVIERDPERLRWLFSTDPETAHEFPPREPVDRSELVQTPDGRVLTLGEWYAERDAEHDARMAGER